MESLKMCLTCVTLALLICVKVYAHGPLHPRIVGGADAHPDHWPWMVSVHNPICHFCGGSLITDEWVLSAAHCFTGVHESSLRVYLGKWTQQGANNQEIMMEVSNIEIHPNYNYKNNDNDIALLQLTSPAPINNFIRPVCLAAQGSNFPSNTDSWIIGWGQIGNWDNLHYPGILQEAKVLVVDNDECNKLLKKKWKHRPVTENMICAGVLAGGTGIFYGDSGGPMMSSDGCSQWVQYGISSFGYGCAEPNKPNVYTRVSQYENWITSIIQNSQSQNLPQFVSLNFPCPSSQSSTKVNGLLSCFGNWKKGKKNG